MKFKEEIFSERIGGEGNWCNAAFERNFFSTRVCKTFDGHIVVRNSKILITQQFFNFPFTNIAKLLLCFFSITYTVHEQEGD